MMIEPAPEKRRNGRIKLLLLMLVAFLPVFVASFAFFRFPALVPQGTTNQGELILPPVLGGDIFGSDMVPEMVALNTWVLIQPLDTDCGEDCRQLMYLSRQVVTGLGKDATRISRVLLSPETLPQEILASIVQTHPDLLLLTGRTDLLGSITPVRPVLFLMDPNGNIMMFYSLEKAGKPMLEDLKHLLRISNIG